MIRLLTGVMSIVVAGCATAPVPKTPEELIVGAWTCTIPAAEIDGAYYVATFRRSGSMNLDFEGQFNASGIAVDVDMEIDGSYALRNGRLGGTFDDTTIHRLLIDGEPVDEDTMSFMDSMFSEMAAGAADSVIDVLDEKQLILLGESGEDYLSCTRRTP